MKKIRDLVIDEQFEQFVLIKSADVRIAKNGKKIYCFYFPRYFRYYRWQVLGCFGRRNQ